MANKSYSVKKLGRNYKVSEHFTLGEFQSRDGADIVLIDDRLLAFLELLRRVLGGDLGRATVGVGSGYRSAAHNRAVGGASQSRHTKGDAADVVCKQDGKRIPGKLICALCAGLGFNGVALNKGSGYSVHLDTYEGRTYRGDERKGYGNNVENGDFYAYFNITKAQVDALKIGEKAEVPKKEEEDEMTKKEIRDIVFECIAEMMTTKAQELPNKWSEEARNWAKTSELMQGTSIGDEWMSYLTREQFAAVTYRFAQKIDPVK